MSKDLEDQLAELGPECRSVVDRLRAGATFPSCGPVAVRRRLPPYLIAASLVLLIGLGVFFGRAFQTCDRATVADRGAHEYQMTVAEMIATQNPDGSWKNDFLTRRNAAVLKACGDLAAQIAYKKAVRNLRVRGVLDARAAVMSKNRLGICDLRFEICD